MSGDSAVNILNGGAGNDTMSGGTGGDTFVFNSALNATTNNDTIIDFSVVDDTINLENAIFTGLTTLGALSTANFITGAGAVALDSNDFLVYDTTDSSLYYDADGSGVGARIEFVSLTGIPTLTAADFVVV